MGSSSKTNIEGWDCLNRGAWTVYRFKGRGLVKKEGGGVEVGVDTPIHTMVSKLYSIVL